ncbi:MAG: CheY-like chemotaxis protein [Thermoproteota archaeon]|jgi:CheY-like chemotaxis protein
MKILILDDSATSLELIKSQISAVMVDIELDIYTTTKPQEALDKIEAEEFDFVLTDFNMPAMNGGEFIEKLKTDNVKHKICVITSFATKKITSVLTVNEKVSVFRKPLKLEDIKDLLMIDV